MKMIPLAAALSLAAFGAQANEFEPQIRAFLNDNIMNWANDPAIINAIMEQNGRNAGLSQADIDALDVSWRAEVGGSNTPTIDPVLSNPSSDFLREQVAAVGGAITEVFTMDLHGLNVAASHTTSDYWQGDEAKFSETYLVGAGAVHISDVEFDESSQTYQAQVSITLVDPATNAPIGAMTVGLNADELF